MKKILIFICALSLILCTYMVQQGRAAGAQLSADDIDNLLDQASEARDNNILTDATNALLKILYQEPKHPDANKMWTEITGRVYTPPPIPVPVVKKEVLTKASMKDTIKKDITTTMGEARSDVADIIDDSTKNIISDAVRELSTDAEFKKEMQKLIAEAFEIEKSNAILSLREGLELPAPVAQVTPTNPTTESTNVNVDPKVKAKAYYDSAVKMLDQQRYDDAKKMLQEAAQLDPTNEDIKKALEKMGP